MALVRRLAASLTADRIAALVFLVVFAAYGIEGYGIPAALDVDIVGPGFFPSFIAVLGVGLALVLLFQRPSGSRTGVFEFDGVALAPVLLLLVYVLSLETLGFPIATVVFLTVTFRYLGCPGWRRAVIYSFASTAALVGLFHYGLELRLPPGELIPFY